MALDIRPAARSVPGPSRLLPVGAPPLAGPVARAAAALARGEPALIFDRPDREGETDIVFLAETMTAEKVRFLRREAGGLLCVTVPEGLMSTLGIGYQQDLLLELSDRHPILAELVPSHLGYDRRSAFGLSVNHRKAFTGATDGDRALTIRSIGEMVRDAPGVGGDELRARFAREFAAPGHVSLLHAARGLLEERQGHTELSTTLATLGGLTPSLALMEMLDEEGGALPVKAAKERAERRGWAFVVGEEIRQSWSAWYG